MRTRERWVALVVGLAATQMINCAARWPKQADTAVSRRRAAQVSQVDVLPVDIQLWADPGAPVGADAAARALSSTARGAAEIELGRLGYTISSAMNWDGVAVGSHGPRQLMTPAEVATTAYSLSGYGQAQARSRSSDPLVPHLPSRLGTRSDADATLYIGGWGYLGKKRKNRAGKVAMWIGAGLVIGAVVVLAAVLTKGEALDTAGKAVGGAAKAGARVAARATGGFGRALARATKGTAQMVGRAALSVGRHGPRIAFEALDAWGRSGTHIDVYAGRPNWQVVHQRQVRHSTLHLEMTLVDNRTGLVVWHARQRFPGSPANPRDVQRAVRVLAATMPRAGRAPGRSSKSGPPGITASL